MSAAYLAQSRYLLIQKLAIQISALPIELDETICSLNTFDFNATTKVLYILKTAFRRQTHDGDRPISPTDLVQYDGMNSSSSIVCARFLR